MMFPKYLGLFFGFCLASNLDALEVTIEEAASPYEMEFDGGTDFSGITWTGGDNYYAVSNRSSSFFGLTIPLDPTGKILQAHFTTETEVRSGLSDFEGIFFNPKESRVYLSAERGHGIVGVNLSGKVLYDVKVPPVYFNARSNKSLESLTGNVDLGQYWTCNEDALTCDGAVSNDDQGALVRMQLFDLNWTALAQYGYRTEPSVFRSKGGGTGVSDLLLLPNGQLLVLERVVSSFGLRTKIFAVSFKNATVTTKLKHLDPDLITGRKTLLFEKYTGRVNFEGITLGPALKDGWRSLLLISDSGGGSRHTLLALRIKY